MSAGICTLCHGATPSTLSTAALTVCEWCGKPGYKLRADKTGCDPCGVGYISLGGCYTSCTACPSGWTTSTPTSLICDDALSRFGLACLPAAHVLSYTPCVVHHLWL
jgi:hypothetical protein